MEFDSEKIDNAVLALLYLTSFREKNGDIRAWKGQDWDTLNRLYEKGLIGNPVSKTKSVCFTDEGSKLSEELFRSVFGKKP